MNRSGTFHRTVAMVIAALMIQAPLGVPLEADAPPIVTSNSDLQNVITYASIVQSRGFECDHLPCPQMDCAQAARILQSLVNLEAALEAMDPWLDQASQDALEAWQSQVGSSIITGENLANAQLAVAWQQYLLNLGSLLLDIAGITSFFKGQLDKLEKGEPLSVSDIDEIYELAQTGESALGTLSEQVTGEAPAKPIAGLVGGANDALGAGGHTDINNLKSDFSDLISVIDNGVKGENGAAGRAAIGQIIGRILKTWAEADMQDRLRRINEMQDTLLAEARAQSARYADWAALDSRKWMAQDALARVRTARASFSPCFTRLCGATSLTRPAFPSFNSWGEALAFFNDLIPRLEAELESQTRGFTIRDACPSTTGIGMGENPCPECNPELQAFRRNAENYEEELQRLSRGEGSRRSVDEARAIRDRALDDLRLCIRFACPPSGGGTTTGGIPGPEIVNRLQAKCPACQPIADEISRTRSDGEQKRAERDRLQSRLERLQTDIQRLQQSLNDSKLSAVVANSRMNVIARMQKEAEAIRLSLQALAKELDQIRRKLETLRRLLDRCEQQKCSGPPPAEDQDFAWLAQALVGVTPEDSEGDNFTPDGVNRTLTPTPTLPPVDRADLSLDKSGSSTTVALGSMVTYTLNIDNMGPADATGVMVTDTIPPGTSVQGSSASQGGCSMNGGNLTCSLGSLANGANAWVMVDLQFDSTPVGAVTNTANVYGMQPDPLITNNDGNFVVNVLETPGGEEEADLGLTKSGPSTVIVGNPLGYSLDYVNNGPANATSVQVVDNFPSGFDFDSATSDQGSCGFSGSSLTCDLGTLMPGQGGLIQIAGTFNGSAGTLTNTASITGALFDPNSSNNTSTAETEASEPAPLEADLGVTKTDLQDPVETDGPIDYTVTITNNGPAAATGVNVTDTMSAGTITGAFASGGSCSGAGTSTLQCTYPSIASGAIMEISITANAPTSPGTVTNTVTIQADQTDPAMANNTATETTMVQEPAVQGCAQGITPGNYTGDGGCGGSGTATVSCNNSEEIRVDATGLQLVCDQDGLCGDQNVIFGQGHHRCSVMGSGPNAFQVNCTRLDDDDNPTGTCTQNFQKQ